MFFFNSALTGEEYFRQAERYEREMDKWPMAKRGFKSSKFYFDDANAPGTVWYGDQRAFDYWTFNGCYPQRWSDKQQTPIGGSVEVKLRVEGELVIEQWDVRAAEAPAVGEDEVFDQWQNDTLVAD